MTWPTPASLSPASLPLKSSRDNFAISQVQLLSFFYHSSGVDIILTLGTTERFCGSFLGRNHPYRQHFLTLKPTSFHTQTFSHTRTFYYTPTNILPHPNQRSSTPKSTFSDILKPPLVFTLTSLHTNPHTHTRSQARFTHTRTHRHRHTHTGTHRHTHTGIHTDTDTHTRIFDRFLNYPPRIFSGPQFSVLTQSGREKVPFTGGR